MLALQAVRETILLSTSRAVYCWVAGGIDYRFAFRMGAVGLQEAAGFGFGWGGGGRGIPFTACGGPAAFVGAFVSGFGAVVKAVYSIPSLVNIPDRRIEGNNDDREGGEGEKNIPAARLTFKR